MNLENSLIRKGRIIPGLGVCALIAATGKILGSQFSYVGGGTFTILLGILMKNTFMDREELEYGSKFAESTILPICIALLGGTVSAGAIAEIGFSGVLFISIQMTVTIISAFLVGKRLGFSENFSLLMASGNAVCGSSAIGATAPVVDASGEERTNSITVVNLTGTVLMLILPLLSSLVFSLDNLRTSALIGGVLQSVGQVVASGSMVGESVKDLSTIFKIVRVLFLVFVVLGLGAFKSRLSSHRHSSHESTSLRGTSIPWYIVVFFSLCALFSFGVISKGTSLALKTASSGLELVALAGIGMNVNLKNLASQGLVISLYAISVASIQVISAILLIKIIF